MRVLPSFLCGAALLVWTGTAPAAPRPVLVVCDLAAMDARPEEATMISELLRNDLASGGRFSVVQRGEMARLAEEQRIQYSGLTEAAGAVRLGRLLNAEKAVVGKVSRLFDRLVLSVQLVDIEKGSIEDAITVDCPEGYAQLRAAVARAARALSGATPDIAPGEPAPSGVAEAEALLARGGEWTEALPALEGGCAAGDPKACLSFGRALLDYKRDWQAARRPLNEACRAGELRACHELGRIYEKFENDQAGARAMYQAACAGGRGVKESCGHLGAGW